LPEEGGEIRHVGDGVPLPVGDRERGVAKAGVKIGLRTSSGGNESEHRVLLGAFPGKIELEISGSKARTGGG
jgi:hypothetical protein